MTSALHPWGNNVVLNSTITDNTPFPILQRHTKNTTKSRVRTRHARTACVLSCAVFCPCGARIGQIIWNLEVSSQEPDSTATVGLFMWIQLGRKLEDLVERATESDHSSTHIPTGSLCSLCRATVDASSLGRTFPGGNPPKDSIISIPR